MKLRFKMIIDRFLGVLIAESVNLLARAAGMLFPKAHRSLPPSFKTVAVCKLIGMGSIIQATPLLNSIRSSFPDVRIIFVSTSANRALLSRIRTIDECVLLDDRSLLSLAISFIKALARLWRYRIDCYLDLEIYSHFSSILTALSMSRYRFGFFKGAYRFSKGIYTHMMYFNIKAPIASVYTQLARLAGCGKLHVDLEQFHPSDQDHHDLNQAFTSAGTTRLPAAGRYVVFNPNASELRIERRWEPSRFVKLADELLSRYPDMTIITIGSVSERQYVSSICEAVITVHKHRVINCSGMLSIGALFALFERSSLVITNDSGPLHIAAAMRRPVIALFGPCSPGQYGSMPGIIPVYKDVYCSPCVHEFDDPPCRGDNACMQSISVEDVMDAAIKLLENGGTAEAWQNDRITYTHLSTNRPLGIVTRD